MAKFIVSRSELTIEAAYPRPELPLFGRDQQALLARLIDVLGAHGLKLGDLKIERGSGTFGELHVLCQNLVDYALTVRVRLDKVEAFCHFLTVENKDNIFAAILDAIKAVRPQISGDYRVYALSLILHGNTEGMNTREYLSQYAGKMPNSMGPIAGNAVAFYFSPGEDWLAASLTLDISLAVPAALAVTIRASWDGSRVTVDLLKDRAEGFARGLLSSVGLELPE